MNLHLSAVEVIYIIYSKLGANLHSGLSSYTKCVFVEHCWNTVSCELNHEIVFTEQVNEWMVGSSTPESMQQVGNYLLKVRIHFRLDITEQSAGWRSGFCFWICENTSVVCTNGSSGSIFRPKQRKRPVECNTHFRKPQETEIRHHREFVLFCLGGAYVCGFVVVVFVWFLVRKNI